jgi:plastocyanin
MTTTAPAKLSSMLLAFFFVCGARVACAEEPVMLSIVIKDRHFEPAELHAPPGRPIAFTVKNLGTIASEFESDTLHVEKVVAAGGEAVVHVRPLSPGRYDFFDDFHHTTKGSLVVP